MTSPSDDTSTSPSFLDGLEWGLIAITTLMPIVGVIWFERNAGFVLAYYWIEAAIVGLLHVTRIWNAGTALDHTQSTVVTVLGLPEAFGRLTHIGRFVLWYGGFWLIYGVVAIGVWAHSAQQLGAEGSMTLGRFVASWATWETGVGVAAMLVDHVLKYMRADAYCEREPRAQGRRGMTLSAVGLLVGAGAIAHYQLHPAWIVALVVVKGTWEGRQVGSGE